MLRIKAVIWCLFPLSNLDIYLKVVACALDIPSTSHCTHGKPLCEESHPIGVRRGQWTHAQFSHFIPPSFVYIRRPKVHYLNSDGEQPWRQPFSTGHGTTQGGYRVVASNMFAAKTYTSFSRCRMRSKQGQCRHATSSAGQHRGGCTRTWGTVA